MQQLKKNKNKLILFAIVFVAYLAICVAFLQPHYVHDTYMMAKSGYESYAYEKFLQEGRPFSALLILFADLINLPIQGLTVVSFVFSVAFMSAAVVSVYSLFKEQISNKSGFMAVLILLACSITIFNYLAIEYILFAESCMFGLGILLSTIAAKFIITNEKYAHVKAFLLVVVAVFCYQFSIAIFAVLVLVHELLFCKKKFKESLIELIKVALIYIVAMLSTVIFVKLFTDISRVNIYLTEINITAILSETKELVVDSLGVIPPYVNIGIIGFTILFIAAFYKGNAREKITYILKYLIFVIAAIGMAIATLLVGSTTDLSTRFCIAYGTTIGISLLTMLYVANINDKKVIQGIIALIVVITFALNALVYIVLTNQCIYTNKKDEENCQIIKQMVEEYEAKTNIQVTKITAARREQSYNYYPGVIHAGIITQNALDSWAAREAIEFYIDRPLNFTKASFERFAHRWAGKTWDEFSVEQIAIEGDTIYYCIN